MIRILAALVAWAGIVAVAAADVQRAVRGLASSVEVEYAPRLKARAEQSPTSPVMVRVAEAGVPGRQRIEFIGMVAGSFDLREFVEREDGRTLEGLASIPVTVVSQLPSDHGTDLYGSGEHGFNWRTHYTQLMWGAAILWLAVPTGALAVRALRRRRISVAVPEAAAPTIEDQLRVALDGARGRALSIEERGQLELLVFRFLTEDGGPTDRGFQSVAQAFCDIRAHPETRDLVGAIEQWLHAKEGGDLARADAAAALEAFRQTRLSGASTTNQAAIPPLPTGARA